jgi:predicted transcriptional regulator YdeE
MAKAKDMARDGHSDDAEEFAAKLTVRGLKRRKGTKRGTPSRKKSEVWMTVEQLISQLQKVKNKKMCAAVCIEGIPYKPIQKVIDSTGSIKDSEKGLIDGLALLVIDLGEYSLS